ncbi:DUF742 domain-containing protein [Streptomyces sp. SL13]|uniref:DUF742 domain-containing protein n=1 Tax=Streptantibioticus silvisoli TaxID=2705255 RepID=A0AA90GZX5_9ACTN|nr:DUF742 domain-containing protein [Streptantibioticus silvisoli]MDI5962821.1 DUF742 domain-containing protein [Streptantibioticus silvisoli]MDI5968438.1 DUF742 domain-containing protein [Streptantibioticus silvisoli]
MAMPPGGHPYGDPQQQAPLKRFNFPSAPSNRAPAEGGTPPEPERPAPYREPERGSVRPEPAPVAPPVPPAPHATAETPRPAAPRIEPHIPSRGGHDGHEDRLSPVGSDHQPLVRPYAMTGGRTRPRYQLALEALVSTTADPDQLSGALPEHQRICHLCQEVKSVAEVSALLSIPLGVARILVADLAEAGFVAIHQPGGDEAAGGLPDVTLLERVLSGLRKL